MAIGTVQKILGSVTRVSQTEFKANYGDDEKGRQAGVYPSIRAAQQVIEQSALGGRRGNWERAVREDGVESYLLKQLVEKLPTGLGYVAVSGSTASVIPGYTPLNWSLAGFNLTNAPTSVGLGSALWVVNNELDITWGVYSGDYLTFNAQQNRWYTANSLFGSAVKLGVNAGLDGNGGDTVSIGYLAGTGSQARYCVAIGREAGYSGQGLGSTAVGWLAGNNNQQSGGTAFGAQAGSLNQQQGGTALGSYAGSTNQQLRATAVGMSAGADSQGANAVAVGFQAGWISQGANAIAIGSRAAPSSQPARTIVVNATTSDLTAPATDSFVIKPVRSSTVSQQTSTMRSVSYDTSTGEMVSLDAAPVPAALGGYKSITSAVSPYAVAATDHFIDLTSGSATATLPTAVGIAGRIYHFKLSATPATFLVNTTSSQTIDGNAAMTASGQWSTMSVISDGANWKRILATGFVAF